MMNFAQRAAAGWPPKKKPAGLKAAGVRFAPAG
jgi:hypothetical protein